MSADRLASNRDELVLEGIVLTLDSESQPHLAPMGPRVDRQISRLLLRPFPTAQTYLNLRNNPYGVFHVTDDVELIAHAAVGRLEMLPPTTVIEGFPCPRLQDTCRWMAFHAEAVDDRAQRVAIDCRVIQQGGVRPFFGFNRAKHAVIEAAILATRIGIVQNDEISREMERLKVIVAKTAGRQERAAFDFLQEYVSQHATP
jgi:hypothetical protein